MSCRLSLCGGREGEAARVLLNFECRLLMSRWAICQKLANQRAPKVNIDINSKPRIMYFKSLEAETPKNCKSRGIFCTVIRWSPFPRTSGKNLAHKLEMTGIVIGVIEKCLLLVLISTVWARLVDHHCCQIFVKQSGLIFFINFILVTYRHDNYLQVQVIF